MAAIKGDKHETRCPIEKQCIKQIYSMTIGLDGIGRVAGVNVWVWVLSLLLLFINGHFIAESESLWELLERHVRCNDGSKFSGVPAGLGLKFRKCPEIVQNGNLT